MADKKDKDKKKGMFGFGSKKKKYDWKLNYVFENLLTDQCLYDDFEDYLSKQHCQENLQFFKEVSTYKALEDKKVLKDEAQKICDKYLGTGPQPLVLNLTPMMLKQITTDLKKPSKTLFEGARMDIEQLLRTNFVSFSSS